MTNGASFLSNGLMSEEGSLTQAVQGTPSALQTADSDLAKTKAEEETVAAEGGSSEQCYDAGTVNYDANGVENDLNAVRGTIEQLQSDFATLQSDEGVFPVTAHREPRVSRT